MSNYKENLKQDMKELGQEIFSIFFLLLENVTHTLMWVATFTATIFFILAMTFAYSDAYQRSPDAIHPAMVVFLHFVFIAVCYILNRIAKVVNRTTEENKPPPTPADELVNGIFSGRSAESIKKYVRSQRK